jgi:hypothetical protein
MIVRTNVDGSKRWREDLEQSGKRPVNVVLITFGDYTFTQREQGNFFKKPKSVVSMIKRTRTIMP